MMTIRCYKVVKVVDVVRLHTKPGVVDGHWSHGNVRLPVNELPDDAVPLLGLVVVDPVHLVWHSVDPGLPPSQCCLLFVLKLLKSRISY